MMKSFLRTDKAAAVTAIILILITVFIFFHGLFNGEVIATNDVGSSDLLYATFPVQALYGEALKNGEFMQWNPYIWGGFPVFAEGPYAFLYPVDLIVWYLFRPIAAMNTAIILNPIIMGLGMYFFARRLLNSSWTAIIPAVAVCICGPILVHTRHYTASTCMALIPWLFYSVEAYLNTKSKFIYGSLLFGSITGLMILTGHPQYVFICVIITSLYLVLRILMLKKKDFFLTVTKEINIKEIIYFFLIAGFISVLIGFPQLKETLALTKFSQRGTENLGEDFTGLGSLPWNGFLTFIYPYFMGNAGDASFKGESVFLFWEYFHYAGVIIFILALIGIFWGWKKSNAIKALTIIGVIFYLMALGTNFPLYKIFSIFPLLKSFRFQVRWLLGTEISIIALSGFGLIAISSFFYNSKTSKDKNQVKQKTGKKLKKLSLIQKIIYPQPALVIITAVIVIGEIYLVSGRQVVTAEPDLYLSSSPLINRIQSKNDGREYSLSSSDLIKSIYSKSHGWEGDKKLYGLAPKSLPPHLASLFHVPVIYGYTALVPNYIYEVWGDATHGGVIHNTASLSSNNLFQPKDTFIKLCKMWNVKYFTASWQMQEPFVKVWDSLGVYAYELPEVFPRSWIVNKVEKIPGDNIQKEAQKLLDNNFNPLEDAICAGDLPILPPDSKNGTAEIISSDNHSIKIKANESGLVVLSDTWYPKWEATVNGKEAPVFRINCSMRGVVSPEAGSIIEMKYNPGNVLLFAVISYLVLFISLGLSIFGISLNNKKSSQ